MALQFELKKVIAEGTAIINQETGQLDQGTTVISGVVGNIYEGKFIQTDFVIFSTPLDITPPEIWASIQAQATVWVQNTYPEIL
jgi:hypothetical protein